MKKVTVLALGLVFAVSGVFAQDKFFTKTGKISFYSKATLENIEANNETKNSANFIIGKFMVLTAQANSLQLP